MYSGPEAGKIRDVTESNSLVTARLLCVMGQLLWIIDFVTHPGVVETVDRINDIAGYYLVEKGNRQYFVKVTKDFITTRELPGKVEGKKFDIEDHRYTKGYRIL